jgi:predicted methyltransferase
MRRLHFTPVLFLTLALASCDDSGDSVAPAPAGDTGAGADPQPTQAGPEVDVAARLTEILAMDHRTEENRVRDAQRHPVETLMFFGIRPDMTVVELSAGGGWYTEILAPLLRERGKLIATQQPLEGPEDGYRYKSAKAYQDKLAAHPEVYDKVQVIPITPDLVLGAPGSADLVLTFRNSHGWFRDKQQEKIYGAAFAVLKSGGVFGVVQHRAAEGADPAKTAPAGYLPEAAVIAAAEAVGFRLEAKSEINANPKDTRDHPEGVWTLPPNLALGDKDRDKYVAIGESDRMTLKFVKP